MYRVLIYVLVVWVVQYQTMSLAHAGTVTTERIEHADDEPDNWLSHGRTYSEERFSTLRQINKGTIKDLGLAWFADFGTMRGQEATPIEVDGVLYVSTAWSIVKAYDATNGRLLWTYDPRVPRETLARACCDAVNRGVAIWGDRVFVGALDGRLIAIDTKTGKQVWSVVTVDRSRDYTITGAPRVVRGKVIIGNGGADMAGGVRGYVSAYDADTGSMAWRFYTVPGDPAKKSESAALEAARKTWRGDIYWRRGGGGTVWDSMAYDGVEDLLYIGTGNGGPWNQAERSPGGGDNLFLSCIVAIRPETGQYVWHYQVNPGDEWDYTATQQMILADVKIGGLLRKVIMQAPKNGFFYVLDRITGRLISAEKIATVNWASSIDLKTGRPVEKPAARYDITQKATLVSPSSRGAHSWQPMAYSRETGLVYIPVQDTTQVFEAEKGYSPRPAGYNTGTVPFPESKTPVAAPRAYLLAWNPATQQQAWRVDHARGGSGGGVLATAGDVVVEGQANGQLTVYDANTGHALWSFDAQSMPMAGPISYAVNGQQYIAVTAGCGGDFSDVCGLVDARGRRPILDRLLVFKIGGTASLPPAPKPSLMLLNPPSEDATPAKIEVGHALYDHYCATCHGVGAVSTGLNPDLRFSPFLHGVGLEQVLLSGVLRQGGMASFSKELDKTSVSAIRTYIVAEARIAKGRGGITK
jgi:quinohemoprotein ethanol dehydrogenase